MCIELTCGKTGNKIHLVKENICYWFKDCGSGDEKTTSVHMVCGACLCVKETPEHIEKLLHPHCDDEKAPQEHVEAKKPTKKMSAY